MMNKTILYFFLFIFSLILSACSRHSDVPHGYIEGRYTYITTNVAGVLQQLFVQRGTFVNKGQALFVLDEKPESYEYDVAKQNYEEAIDARDAISADLAYAKITYERNKTLVEKRVMQQSLLDNARARYAAYIAQLAQANTNIIETKAKLAEANWTVGRKKLFAPVNAIVFDIYFRLGEYTLANQAILSLLAPQDIKAIFFIPEKELSRLKLADPIFVHCDGCKNKYKGKISFISPTAEYTPPVIYSDQTRDKLIFRIEAEFSPEDAMHLHPGQPISITYVK